MNPRPHLIRPALPDTGLRAAAVPAALHTPHGAPAPGSLVADVLGTLAVALLVVAIGALLWGLT